MLQWWQKLARQTQVPFSLCNRSFWHHIRSCSGQCAQQGHKDAPRMAHEEILANIVSVFLINDSVFLTSCHGSLRLQLSWHIAPDIFERLIVQPRKCSVIHGAEVSISDILNRYRRKLTQKSSNPQKQKEVTLGMHLTQRVAMRPCSCR